MNIAGLPPKQKAEMWCLLKEKHGDIAKLITEITQAFPGEYKYISVSRVKK